MDIRLHEYDLIVKTGGRYIMEKIYEFIKNCKVYFLATVDDDRARVRPFGTIDLFEDRLYIQTSKEKAVSKQIHENPNVELCCFNGDEWLRLRGKLAEDKRIQAKEHLLDNYPNLKKKYSAYDGNTEVFYFTEGKSVISSFTAEPKIIKF